MLLPFFHRNSPSPRGVMRAMMLTISMLVVGGIILMLGQAIANRVTSVLLALSCILLGGLVGFLFGIPRVLQTDVLPSMASLNGDLKAANGYQLQVNTNLEQISDWLTKMIVGLGLVNLYKLPQLLRQAAELIAGDIAEAESVKQATIFANALILYFPILGFLIGYLMTRIFLSSVFRIADTGGLLKINIDGQSVALQDVVKNLVSVVADQEAAGTTQRATGREKNIDLPGRILWVDDNPGNNVVQRAIFKKAGIEVIQALSTAEGIGLLADNTFDLIISDMGRNEDGIYNKLAGMDFLHQVKSKNLSQAPILIFTDRANAHLADSVKQFGAKMVFGTHALMSVIGFS